MPFGVTRVPLEGVLELNRRFLVLGFLEKTSPAVHVFLAASHRISVAADDHPEGAKQNKPTSTFHSFSPASVFIRIQQFLAPELHAALMIRGDRSLRASSTAFGYSGLP